MAHAPQYSQVSLGTSFFQIPKDIMTWKVKVFSDTKCGKAMETTRITALDPAMTEHTNTYSHDQNVGVFNLPFIYR